MCLNKIDIIRSKHNISLNIRLPCSGNSKEMSTSQTKAINISNNNSDEKIAKNVKNHTKSLPKPILKKPKESSSFSNYRTVKNITSPTFYSGNETKYSSYNDSINSYDNQTNHDQSNNSSCSSSLEEAEKSELKDQFLDQINFSNINLNYYKNHYKHQDHLTQSSLVKHSSLTKPHKLKVRKRTQSEVYVYHSKDINQEIIKLLIQSTNSFIIDFKTKNQCPSTDDKDLFKYFKSEFTDSLKDYLLNTSDNYYDRSHHLDIGVTLSEPLISEIQECRAKSEKESKLSESHSESLFYHNFFTNSIDSSGNVKNETHIYGSLPTTSFFDLYAPKASINCRNSIDASSTIVTRKNAKEKCKNIINEASTNKKIVRFADSFGLELEKVKMITNNSFVDAFSYSNEYGDDDPFKPKQTDANTGANDDDKFNTKPFLVLIPLFGLRKQDTIVRLDDYVYDYENKLIRCIIKVRNLHYVKRVYARITFNNWKTHYDMDAMYIKSDPNPSTPITQIHHLHGHGAFGGSSSNLVVHAHPRPYNYDYFGFCILLPEKNDQTTKLINPLSSSPFASDDCTLRVEFALCFQWDNGKNTAWDNNSGENYKFQCFYNK
jgi:hypothetical protein